MINFRDKKQKEERGVTVNELIDSVVERKPDNIIVISWNNREETYIGWSSNSDYEIISRLEIAKQNAIDSIMYAESDD